MGSSEAPGLRLQLRQSAPVPLEAEIQCGPGELLALVGPSGSGKTTLLRCIAGLDRPAEGRIACNGTLWLDTGQGINVPPQARSVGLVFQHYALFPHLTALDNVSAALGHLPRRYRAERARELLALVHLAGLEARRPAELSGGQQQRVAVARALARDPQALLLDEPFSAVDQVTRRKLQKELAQLRHRFRIPIVLVTHDLEEARMLADRMVILHHGRTLQDGPPQEVLARPRNALVARLTGLTNLFEGTVLEHRVDSGFTLLKWRGYTLEARLNPRHEPGTRVSWVIPAENVILHRRDRPSRGERENPVAGIIGEFTVLGENANVVVLVDSNPEAPLAMSVPTHVARRNGLRQGEAVKVSLLAAGIHIMPLEPLADGHAHSVAPAE